MIRIIWPWNIWKLFDNTNICNRRILQSIPFSCPRLCHFTTYWWHLYLCHIITSDDTCHFNIVTSEHFRFSRCGPVHDSRYFTCWKVILHLHCAVLNFFSLREVLLLLLDKVVLTKYEHHEAILQWIHVFFTRYFDTCHGIFPKRFSDMTCKNS